MRHLLNVQSAAKVIPCFYVFLMEARVMTFVANCTLFSVIQAVVLLGRRASLAHLGFRAQLSFHSFQDVYT